ncbi:ExbD/TolR family protein [Mucilaginibacter ginkgonis]|uniref:Biopolymer transporter ExbD n=1 Tax=Mucilaginibacter ginkgonis TaxID=2682091 RepID=A0A6I4INK0_9SPHI|nr:biopolymer transporter ExbD [Mucilaginibacter ginkgonis]QQL49671.1 biopolymer transporter ExbD [Mucilaginibacter ginkgonis]
MPRVKIKRKSTVTDMTAMCDVAFLLLTFFILTAKPKAEEPVPVDTPNSSVTIKLPETNIATLVVGSGKVFYDITGAKVRVQALEQMGSKYGITFTDAEKRRYSNLQAVGVPMNQMKQYLDLESDKAEAYKQPGIPTDSVSNELFNWIRESRIANVALNNQEMRLSIKGNSKEEYPTIKKVIDILQKQKVNKFSLITSLKQAPKK